MSNQPWDRSNFASVWEFLVRWFWVYSWLWVAWKICSMEWGTSPSLLPRFQKVQLYWQEDIQHVFHLDISHIMGSDMGYKIWSRPHLWPANASSIMQKRSQLSIEKSHRYHAIKLQFWLDIGICISLHTYFHLWHIRELDSVAIIQKVRMHLQTLQSMKNPWRSELIILSDEISRSMDWMMWRTILWGILSWFQWCYIHYENSKIWAVIHYCQLPASQIEPLQLSWGSGGIGAWIKIIKGTH